MKRLPEWLWRACSELGLRADMSFNLALPTMPQVTAVARIRNLGAANGMLVFSRHDEIRDFTQHLLDAGYGYSVLDEPGSNEAFDLESFRDVFRDWGWSGELGGKPDWMR